MMPDKQPASERYPGVGPINTNAGLSERPDLTTELQNLQPSGDPRKDAAAYDQLVNGGAFEYCYPDSPTGLLSLIMFYRDAEDLQRTYSEKRHRPVWLEAEQKKSTLARLLDFYDMQFQIQR